MFARPAEVSDADVAASLRRDWGIDVHEIAYAPLGFGSHHWQARSADARWFVTVDDLDSKLEDADEPRSAAHARLEAAFEVAARLRADGHAYVVAAERSLQGRMTEPLLNERFVVSVFGHVDGEVGGHGQQRSAAQVSAVLDCITELHRADSELVAIAPPDAMVIPLRGTLEARLVERVAEESWGPGPFASGAQRLVAEHSEAVRGWLNTYDSLADRVAQRPERRVLTHGEPHGGNTMTHLGKTLLIDWDTARVAPPERDLWMLVQEQPDVLAWYTSATGTEIDHDALALYRRWWRLCEISLFSNDLARPHDDDANTRVAWRELQHYLTSEPSA